MNGSDFRVLLRSSGLTLSELAAQVDIDERRLGRWMSSGKIPPRVQWDMFIHLSAAYQERQARGQGARCEWFGRYMARLVRDVEMGREPDESGYGAHVATCSICAGREAWEETHPFPAGLPDLPLLERLMLALLKILVPEDAGVPLLYGIGALGIALLVRFVLPSSPHWDFLLVPVSLGVGVSVGVTTYRALVGIAGDSSVARWLSRFGGAFVGHAWILGVPYAAGSRLTDGVANGISVAEASVAIFVMSIIAAIGFKDLS